MRSSAGSMMRRFYPAARVMVLTLVYAVWVFSGNVEEGYSFSNGGDGFVFFFSSTPTDVRCISGQCNVRDDIPVLRSTLEVSMTSSSVQKW